MGACASVDEKAEERKNEQPKGIKFPLKQVDRENLVQTQKKNEEIRRNPEDICGNQFCVDELDNCKVIVNDVCDSMMIDRCVDSELILACVRGSVFIRDCKNCKFQIVSGQFRCRSCVNCDFFLHVKTGPVVESSSNCRLGCSTLYYPELLKQMSICSLDRCVNSWTDCHDFTPKEGNYSYSNGVKLELDIMNLEGKCLPFLHQKNIKNKMQTIKVQIDATKIEDLVEKSYNDNVYLINIQKDDDKLICTFEDSTIESFQNNLSTLNPTILND